MTVTSSWSGAGGKWSILVHGGAGDLPADRVDSHAEGCRRAVLAASRLLEGGAAALDAVQAAVEVLENDSKFNAGTGASLSATGHLELDAAIMEGAALRAGAVCSLPAHKNPIAIARAVLEDGEHVMYSAEGAVDFAKAAGFEPADEATMVTEAARKKLASAIAGGKAESWAGGTVGAVARDSDGHVAAATSTGGTSGKRRGRVGDTPIIGAGTFADDGAGAASATGYGEGILRVNLTAFTLAAVRGGETPERAARAAIAMMSARVGATGGLIVVGPDGTLGFARSTTTMSWAASWDGGTVEAGA